MSEYASKALKDIDDYHDRMNRLIREKKLEVMGEILFDSEIPTIIVHCPANNFWREASADFLSSFLQNMEHWEDDKTKKLREQIIPIEKRNRELEAKAKKNRKVYR